MGTVGGVTSSRGVITPSATSSAYTCLSAANKHTSCHACSGGCHGDTQKGTFIRNNIFYNVACLWKKSLS